MDVTRRDFLRLSTATAGGTAVGGLAGLGASLAPALARAQALRIKDAKVTPSICPYCSVGCATLVHTVEDRIVNIEGDPRPDLLHMVHAVKPTQCTLVPVRPGEITSQAGWSPHTPRDAMAAVVRGLQSDGIRVSIFVDPEEAPIRWAADIGADRVELYTEPFARAFQRGDAAGRASFETYAAAARLAASLGLGINAGHDLDLENLVLFRNLPHLDEVSIGHALISHALFVGLERSVRDYLEVLSVN